MATIYLSSTYEDLKDYRRVVVEALRKSGHDIVAMEDYVATDQRPVDKCLQDVEQADIYVGLFAFRYGYVPPSTHNNPNGLSITELEFRHAEARTKCLTFVVDDATPWPRMFDDAHTAEDKGERIKTLRQHLLTEKLASSFSFPHELATLVLAAVARCLEDLIIPEPAIDQAPTVSGSATWDIAEKGSPYPGLMHFSRKYAPVFFGREMEVGDILDRMRGPEGRFIIISGDSGVGKSSVVDAGVLPKIEEGGLLDSKPGLCVRMLPSQGNHPFNSLMTTLGTFATRAGLDPEDILKTLKQSPETLTSQIQNILSNGTDCKDLVLFLDQMEELFTAQNLEESTKFLKALYKATQEGALWVVATIRSDHLHHCHGHPDMLGILRGPGHYPLGAIESFMLSAMIVKPARCAGLSITDILADRIVRETGSELGNLPLLAFALNQLFEKRSDHDLPEAVYKNSGGVTGAIAKHAEQVERTMHSDQHVGMAMAMMQMITAQNLEESTKFLKALYKATQEGALWVVATIRSDHLHHCHGHPDMLGILRGPGHYPLGAIESFMLSAMIVKPARCAGLSITDILADRIVRETGSELGNLPLLAFALNQLFEKRSDHDLPEAVYKNSGGVTGAIAKHAEQVERTMHSDQGAKASNCLSQLFQSLVIVNAEGLPTRRRPLRSEFPPEMSEFINIMVRERLLHTEGEGNNATVSISHEKLFEAWPSLRDYVARNKKQLMDQTLLESRARKWVDMGKPWFSGLAIGGEYMDFLRAGFTLTPVTKDYLHASRRAGWVWKGVLSVVVFLIVGTTWLWQKNYSLDQALLKVQSIFVSIHVAPDMETVSGGTYRQGDIHGLGESWRNPVREVTLKDFALGKYEVTFEEYDSFAIATGRKLPGDQGWGRGRRPVMMLSWENARDYAAWVSDKTGMRFRLPTESEWEYAARSRVTDQVWAGTSDEEQLGKYAVYRDNSGMRTAMVGKKKPNGLGLHDMSGNVWEWVEDCWHENYKGAPEDGSAWLEAGGGSCDLRVIRGGSWFYSPGNLRSSYRNGYSAGSPDSSVGFRLAQDIR